MNLQPKYFDFIKDGTKRIELRLFDEKRDYFAKMKNKNCGIYGIINMKSITNHTNIGKL